MRTVQLSTATFAAIWSNRKDGEDSEDAILARLLRVKLPAKGAMPEPGYRDKRFGVEFPTGFRTSRVFKGTSYEAEAVDGRWQLLSTRESYDSLSALGTAIRTGIENVWQNWHFVDGGSKRQPIASLRDPAKVTKRPRRS